MEKESKYPINRDMLISQDFNLVVEVEKKELDLEKGVLNVGYEYVKLTCKEDFRDSIIDFMHIMTKKEYIYGLKVLQYFFPLDVHESLNYTYFTVDNKLNIEAYVEPVDIIQNAKKFTHIVTLKDLLKMEIAVHKPMDFVVNKEDPTIFGVIKYVEPKNMHKFTFTTDIDPYNTFRVPFEYTKLASREAIVNYIHELFNRK